jgi:hypothetical protein
MTHPRFQGGRYAQGPTIRDTDAEAVRAELEVLYVKHWPSDEMATFAPMASIYTRR